MKKPKNASMWTPPPNSAVLLHPSHDQGTLHIPQHNTTKAYSAHPHHDTTTATTALPQEYFAPPSPAAQLETLRHPLPQQYSSEYFTDVELAHLQHGGARMRDVPVPVLQVRDSAPERLGLTQHQRAGRRRDGLVEQDARVQADVRGADGVVMDAGRKGAHGSHLLAIRDGAAASRGRGKHQAREEWGGVGGITTQATRRHKRAR